MLTDDVTTTSGPVERLPFDRMQIPPPPPTQHSLYRPTQLLLLLPVIYISTLITSSSLSSKSLFILVCSWCQHQTVMRRTTVSLASGQFLAPLLLFLITINSCLPVSLTSAGPRPLALHLNSSTQVCPASVTNSTPCSCYGSVASGVFLECNSASVGQISRTLSELKSSSNSVRSVSIYRLNETAITTLPGSLFKPFTSLSELHISSTDLTKMGTEQAFAGLEDSLRTLSFVNSRIGSVPKSSLSKLRQLNSLDIQANRIANLDSYAFYGLPLKQLNLQNNVIENLHEFAFGGLENTLEELSLIGNRLENFPLFALRRLRRLQTLKLQSNLISQIPDDGFTRFTVLETLDLQSNRIRHLSSRSFLTMPKLKTLYCSNNLLTVVSDSSIFVPLRFLETLDLSLNRLRVVNLDGLESIRTLDLSYNHLHDLRLQGMTGLRELFASHNNILQLVNETFLNTTALEVLYLQHNSIHSITYNALHRLTELRVLDLSYNQISELHSSLFKFGAQLESLYLDNNLLTDSGLDSGIFQELVELRDLRLQRNLLKHIRKGVFYSLPNLQELDLQLNQIETIESFESLANLQHLNLQGNRLATFSGNVLSSFPSSLRYLQLSNNQLDSVQNETFLGQNELEVIWLNHNRLSRITVATFTDAVNVERLYLDHNHISVIEEGAFASLKNLLYLNLEHNQLTHLNGGIFSGLHSLQELRLANSEIIGIEPAVMEHLVQLETLDLSHNQIYTIRRNIFHNANKIHHLYLRNVMADEIEADSFESLSLLQVLDISGNNLNAPKLNSIRLPQSIQQLNISYNNLSNEKGVQLASTFIEQIGQSLAELDLSATHFHLQHSAKFFSTLQHLKLVNIDSNEVTSAGFDSLPASGVSVHSVQRISLCDNLLDSIPNATFLSHFAPSLSHLSLRSNQIKQIQVNAFRNLTQLYSIDLAYNRISVIETGAFATLARLTSIDLSHNVLRSLSAGVFDNLPSLQHLSLEQNWLQFVPNNLLRLASSGLHTLIVDHNPMIRLREDLSGDGETGSVPSLQTLKAQHGNISIIGSHDFAGIVRLTHLHLADNKIQTISPSAFRPLNDLIELDLSRNKLDNLPEERLGGLKSLQLLNLSHNSLTELPHFTTDLTAITNLDISFNRISRIESFGRLGPSVREISLRHNMIGWIGATAFANLTSLTRIDLRQNFLTQISEAIFESIEVRLQIIMLAGNPFQCDCRLLSIYQWLEEHSRLVKLDDEEEIVCDQPEKLKHYSILSLQPIDFCPIPMITLFEVAKLESSAVRLRWEVQNETLVGGFTLEYYLTSERSLTSPAGLQLNPAARTAELRDLVSEKWYTVCVEANGKYLRTSPAGSSLPPSSALDYSPSRPTAFVADHHHQKHLLQDFVTGNRKCSQIRTPVESRKLIAIPAASIIIAIGLFFILILCVCVLAFILFRFRNKRKIQRQRSATVVSFGPSVKPDSVDEIELDHPEEYITYRHFPLPSTENVYT